MQVTFWSIWVTAAFMHYWQQRNFQTALLHNCLMVIENSGIKQILKQIRIGCRLAAPYL